jgi:hypothetical protein
MIIIEENEKGRFYVDSGLFHVQTPNNQIKSSNSAIIAYEMFKKLKRKVKK